MIGEAIVAATAVLTSVMTLMIGLGAAGSGRESVVRLNRLRATPAGAVGPVAPPLAAIPQKLEQRRMILARFVAWFKAFPRLPRGAALDEDELEESLYALSAAMEAGAGLIQALSMTADQSPPRLATEFRRVVEEFGAGVPLPQCLDHARARVGHPSFNSLCDTIDIQRLSGGDLRAGLASLAEIIRERRDLRQELKVKTTEARQSAFVLALIPPVIAVLAWVMNPELMKPLLVYPSGRLGLAAGAGLWFLGGWTVTRLTRVKDIEE